MNPGNVVYRLAALAVLVVASLVYLSPLVLPADFPLPSFLQREPLHLGLDLRGGTHLLFAVDVEKAVENNLGRAADELRRELKDQKIQTGEITQQGKTLRLSLTSPDQRAAFDDLVKNRFPNLVMTSQSSDGPPVIELSPSPREQEQQRRFAIDQSLETIRNRIDQFGVSEPSIQRQGDQDIVVQLPACRTHSARRS